MSQPVLIVVLVGIEAEIARARTLRRREKRLGTYTLSAGHTRRLLTRRAQGDAGVALARNLALGNELRHVVRTIAHAALAANARIVIMLHSTVFLVDIHGALGAFLDACRIALITVESPFVAQFNTERGPYAPYAFFSSAAT